ncbi:unnamed protein product [Prorocentrum cordatum]|uniref:PUB domain-containing protein n=1 Tax=Prorocentrum cordatum TaxID=2364126 RepID=A0ABN9SS85_9DINO|nr:unnamed protein product [Polarella glacialis]
MLNPEEYNCDPHLLVPGATVTTGELVASVASASPDARRSFEVLARLVRNVLEQPAEPKFWEVAKANSSVQSAVVDVPSCARLLRRCGFADDGCRFRLQGSGLRCGEAFRLAAALAEQPLAADLAEDLGRALRGDAGAQAPLGGGQGVAAAGAEPAWPARYLSMAEAEAAGRRLSRPGWTCFQGCDAEPEQDAHAMPLASLEACMECAETHAFGGFCAFEGTAYFRETPGAELWQALQRCPAGYEGACFYIYQPKVLAQRAEDDELERALRLSLGDC